MLEEKLFIGGVDSGPEEQLLLQDPLLVVLLVDLDAGIDENDVDLPVAQMVAKT